MANRNTTNPYLSLPDYVADQHLTLLSEVSEVVEGCKSALTAMAPGFGFNADLVDELCRGVTDALGDFTGQIQPQCEEALANTEEVHRASRFRAGQCGFPADLRDFNCRLGVQTGRAV